MAQRRQAGPAGSDGAADHAAENAQQAKDAAQEKRMPMTRLVERGAGCALGLTSARRSWESK
jgi:hypothetical protein